MTTENYSSQRTLKAENLLFLLKQGKVSVNFTKKDGTERVMLCTLLPEFIEPYEKKTERVREVLPDVVSVWDIEAKGWRSIVASNINTVEYII